MAMKMLYSRKRSLQHRPACYAADDMARDPLRNASAFIVRRNARAAPVRVRRRFLSVTRPRREIQIEREGGDQVERRRRRGVCLSCVRWLDGWTLEGKWMGGRGRGPPLAAPHVLSYLCSVHAWSIVKCIHSPLDKKVRGAKCVPG